MCWCRCASVSGCYEHVTALLTEHASDHEQGYGLYPGHAAAQFAHLSPEPVSCMAASNWASNLSLDTCTAQMGADPALPRASHSPSLAVFVLILCLRKTAGCAGFAAGLEWDPSLPWEGVGPCTFFYFYCILCR